MSAAYAYIVIIKNRVRMNNQKLMQYGPLFARIALASVFLASGTQMLFSLSGTASFIGGSIGMGGILAVLLAVVIIAVKILGGLAVATGYKYEWGAWALIGFIALTIILIHNNMAEMVSALKNLGLIGGLLMVIMYGPGPMVFSPKKSSEKMVSDSMDSTQY